MNSSQVSFSRKDPTSFFRNLNKRVNTYFKENNIKKSGNTELHIKTGVMLVLYIVPFVLLLSLEMPLWAQFLLTIMIGVGMAGVGMNVMHDANHGAYSSKSWLNKIMGGTMYILAGNVYNWQVQHNVLHHTYTNIHGHDEDLDAGRIIRFSKHSEWKPFHRFQHYYGFLLYGLLTLNWVFTTDFLQTKRYLKRRLSYGKMPKPWLQWSTLILTKCIYFFIWIGLPMLFMDNPWWQILIGFFVLHYTGGLILSMVFQLAHVVEDTEMPLPDEEGNMKNSWAIHQLLTTVNFSTGNRLVNWFTGGLNHQVEHHIFPHISHVHYRKIAEIVRSTAREFNLPYNEYKSTRSALAAHFRHLRLMGYKPAMN